MRDRSTAMLQHKTAQSVILVPSMCCSTAKISLPNCWLDQEKVVRQ